MKNQDFTFAYFGSSELSVFVLDELKHLGIMPSLIVSTPDKHKGRKLVLTPTSVTLWARTHNIPVITPQKLDDAANAELSKTPFDVFVVASYGKIIPQKTLDISRKGVLNVHPSLLPTYRGPAPLQTAILDDNQSTGVSIMLLDSMMDHGPILAQAHVNLPTWPILFMDLKKTLAEEGARMLADVIPKWIAGTLEAKEQDHSKATFTKKITKEDGLIELSDPSAPNPALDRQNFLKYCAYTPWPSVYFFIEKDGKKTRIKITKARFENEKFVIEKVIPEGKGEIEYKSLSI